MIFKEVHVVWLPLCSGTKTMRMNELLAWLGWLGQVVRAYVASATCSKAKSPKRPLPQGEE
jgi:hypothetical protein